MKVNSLGFHISLSPERNEFFNIPNFYLHLTLLGLLDQRILNRLRLKLLNLFPLASSFYLNLSIVQLFRLFFLPICIILHLSKLSFLNRVFVHLTILSISFCILVVSSKKWGLRVYAIIFVSSAYNSLGLLISSGRSLMYIKKRMGLEERKVHFTLSKTVFH